MIQTIYDRALRRTIACRTAGLTPSEVIETLQSLNLLSPARCKAFLAKERVAELMAEGMTKIDAMFQTAEEFCCSYECIRKYIYYIYK